MTTDTTTVIQHQDGRIELSNHVRIDQSPLYNHDLAPVAISARTWTTYNFAALWMAMSACIPSYLLASGLISKGMNWWQAIFTIMLGNVIVLAPILLNSHPGTKYGIPFPVFARASYGTHGSNLPALMRAVVACGWFGINAWIGGQALNVFFKSIIPTWPTMLGDKIGGYPPTEWFSFALFWGLNVFIIYRGMDFIRGIANVAAPFVMAMTALLLIWAVYEAHGIGAMLQDPGKFQSFADFLPVFIPALTGIIGFWATLSLNMPDFTRFGRSQREQTLGQVVALPTTMTLFCAMSVVITSAATVIYPGVPMSQLWDPVQLIGRFQQPLIVAIGMFSVCVATLCVNIAANVVSPANDFANAFPRWISFRTGGLITGIIGLFMQPWKLLADPTQYIITWLVGYSGGLGAIAGVLIADYWLIRKQELILADLYLEDGAYKYNNGWNWRAVVATLAGCFFAWIGLAYKPLFILYEYAWFVGFAVSTALYYVLMKAVPPAAVSQVDGE